MELTRWRSPTWRSVDLRAVVFTSLMSVWELGLVITDRGSVPACFGCLGMTLPGLWVRRSPLVASLALTAGCVVNNLLLGHLVRCGPFFAVVWYAVFVCAARPSWRIVVGGLVSTLVSIEIQVRYDPILGQSQLLFITAVMLPFFAAGLLAGLRARTNARLEASTEELLAGRELTAELAVLADRDALSAELIEHLAERLAQIADLAGSTDDFQPRLAAIESQARDTLDQMRRSVRTVRAEPGSAPARA